MRSENDDDSSKIRMNGGALKLNSNFFQHIVCFVSYFCDNNDGECGDHQSSKKGRHFENNHWPHESGTPRGAPTGPFGQQNESENRKLSDEILVRSNHSPTIRIGQILIAIEKHCTSEASLSQEALTMSVTILVNRINELQLFKRSA